jgi:putative addiction module killer protein
MERKIKTYGGYFDKFMNTLTDEEQDKIQYGLMLLKTQDKIPAKFIGHIKDGLFELRIEYNGNIYRVFFIFDEGQIVVLFNGFQKKNQKTPPNEIKKAINLKEEYYADKRAHKQSSNC